MADGQRERIDAAGSATGSASTGYDRHLWNLIKENGRQKNHYLNSSDIRRKTRLLLERNYEEELHQSLMLLFLGLQANVR
ncbi:hypothetical protein TIFTF001_000343 [Ficus carica]|uniref:Uncharacterized protein n=1 Tax=Ficus carica TaxID=3494 RepID=A0AA87Z1S0_FICCA|nr:hypothetical protein TIFTF001_000343 [Ficus carica]